MKRQRSYAERGIGTSVDGLISALRAIFADNPTRTLTELRETLARRGTVVHRRSLRTALDKMVRQGVVTVELLHPRCAIYSFREEEG